MEIISDMICNVTEFKRKAKVFADVSSEKLHLCGIILSAVSEHYKNFVKITGGKI